MSASAANHAESIVRQLFRCIDGQAWSELPTLFDERIVYERPGYGAFVGLQRVMEFYRSERIVLRGEHVIEHLVAAEHSLVCIGTFRGLSRTNVELEARFADYYELEDHRIVFRRTYFYSPSM